MSDDTNDPLDTGSPAHTIAGYQVGYKTPPKQNQFKKGVSGNPKGRPKRDGNLLRYHETLMNEQQATLNGPDMSKREALVRILIESARLGKTRPFKTFLQRARKAKLFAPPADEKPRSGVVTYKQDVTTALAQLEAVRAERKEVLARVARGELKETSDD
jgi:hypothetical protein